MHPLPGFTMRVLRTIANNRANHQKRIALRRKNMFDPVLERGARYDTTRVPVEEVNGEWWLNAYTGRRAHMRSGIYYEVFQQILQCSPYTPVDNFTVTYPPTENMPDITTTKENTQDSIEQKEPQKPKENMVLLGNQFLPESVAIQPKVTINWNGFDNKYATILLVNPDGYLLDNQFQLLHWLVANIPRDEELMAGQVLKEYLQPLPFYGTGLHRYVFFLIEHDKPIEYYQITPKENTNPITKFEERIFLTSKFLSDNQLIPSECVCFRLFQSMWDPSVSSCMINDLKVSEPYYTFYVPLTKGQKVHEVIREVRSNKYRLT